MTTPSTTARQMATGRRPARRHLVRRRDLGRAGAGQAPGKCRQADRRHHSVLRRALPVHGALSAPRRVSPFDSVSTGAGLRLLQVGQIRRSRHPAAVGCRHGFCGAPRRCWRHCTGASNTACSATAGRGRHSRSQCLLTCKAITAGQSNPSRWCGYRAWSPASTSPARAGQPGDGCSPRPRCTHPSSAPPQHRPSAASRHLAARRTLAVGLGHAAGRDGRHPPVPAVQPAQPGRPRLVARRTATPRSISPSATTWSSAPTRSTAAWCSTPTRPQRPLAALAGHRQAYHHADGAVQDLEHPRALLRLRHHPRPRAAPPLQAGHARHRAGCECARPGRREAAYRDGDPWRQALIDYLRGNRDRVEATVAACPACA